MPTKKNPLWTFFVSIKLALAILIILAAVSILGTLIKQGQAPDFYLAEYGKSAAQLLETLQLNRMYSSWWYIGLLALFAINLLACSIERLPAAWRTMTQDNLLNPPQNLEKMGCRYRTGSKQSPEQVADKVAQALADSNWKKVRRRVTGDTTLLFVQKGAWSRLGVYIVHFSILMVLAGGITGSLFGFQAYVYLPEGRTTEQIFKRYTKEPYPLGYSLRCDRVAKSYYPNGMIKQYHTDLTVLDPDRETPYQKSIIVNDPLSYKGLTFYQGDALPTQEFFVEIINRSNGMRQAFRIPPKSEIDWPEAGLWLQVEDLNFDQNGNALEGNLALRDHSGTTSAATWITNDSNRMVSFSGEKLDIYFRQMQSALLLISKDPGVPIVYAGCIIMLIGLCVCFLFTHRRIWVEISSQDKRQSLILIGGVSNKNKAAFEGDFAKLEEKIASQVIST